MGDNQGHETPPENEENQAANMEITPSNSSEEQQPPPADSVPDGHETTPPASTENTPSKQQTTDENITDPDDPQHTGKKRVYQSDSDSDSQIRQRRAKIRPQPNLKAARPKDQRGAKQKDITTFDFLQ